MWKPIAFLLAFCCACALATDVDKQKRQLEIQRDILQIDLELLKMQDPASSSYCKVGNGHCSALSVRQRTLYETLDSCLGNCQRKPWCKYFYHVSPTTGDGACHLFDEGAEFCKDNDNKAWTKYASGKSCTQILFWEVPLNNVWESTGNKIWSDSECDNIGNPHPSNLRACIEKCEATLLCKAVNWHPASRGCSLRRCTKPVPFPETDSGPGFQGYRAIKAVKS